MYNIKKIQDELYWIGANDRKITLFENIFPIDQGVSYNSYLLLDEKVVIFDSVDRSVKERFFENIIQLLNGRKVDYLIVQHVEPDHCGAIQELLVQFESMKIVASKKAVEMMKQYFNIIEDDRFFIVNEGDILSTGTHELKFFMAPMIHWPEVMVTYDVTQKILFSADAFGTFNALSGAIFADEYDFEREFLGEARRYYANIVGKYGKQVQALFKKIETIEIDIVCPLHGPIWRNNIEWFLDKYNKWSQYQPEEAGVVIAYASHYGNTENAAEILASKLVDNGVRNVVLFDVSRRHPSHIVAAIFQYSHVVFASPTYNGGVVLNMDTLLHDLKHVNVQNRTVGIMENGSWAIMSGNKIMDMVKEMNNMTILESKVTISAVIKEEQLREIEQLAAEIGTQIREVTL